MPMPPPLLLLPARDGDGGPLRPGTVTAKDAAAANAFVVVLVGVAPERSRTRPGEAGTDSGVAEEAAVLVDVSSVGAIFLEPVRVAPPPPPPPPLPCTPEAECGRGGGEVTVALLAAADDTKSKSSQTLCGNADGGGVCESSLYAFRRSV